MSDAGLPRKYRSHGKEPAAPPQTCMYIHPQLLSSCRGWQDHGLLCTMAHCENHGSQSVPNGRHGASTALLVYAYVYTEHLSSSAAAAATMSHPPLLSPPPHRSCGTRRRRPGPCPTEASPVARDQMSPSWSWTAPLHPPAGCDAPSRGSPPENARRS
jgi:hypothetical protein